MKGYQLYHNYFRELDTLGKTPAEAPNIKIDGRNKWVTVIQNTCKVANQSDYFLCNLVIFAMMLIDTKNKPQAVKEPSMDASYGSISSLNSPYCEPTRATEKTISETENDARSFLMSVNIALLSLFPDWSTYF